MPDSSPTASVKIKVGGGHSQDSIPKKLRPWMETELTRLRLPYAFIATLRAAIHTTGVTQVGLRAVRVEGNSVLIVAKSGNNDTCRELYIRCSEMGPEELLERINASKTKEEEGERMVDHPVSPEGGVAPAPAPVEVECWFPTDEVAVALMLTELAPLACRRMDGGVKYFLLGQVKPVFDQLVTKPKGKEYRYQDILGYLVEQKLLDHTQSETGSGQWNAYNLTALAEEIVKKTVGEPAPVPAPPAPPTSLAPGKHGSSKSVIAFGLEVGALAAELQQYEAQFRDLRQLRKEETDLERSLEIKRAEAAAVQEDLPPGILEKYERLITIAKSSDSSSG